MLISYLAPLFKVALQVIPTRSWSPEVFSQDGPPSPPSVSGYLDVTFEASSTLKGTFKTAHPGSPILSSNTLPTTLPPSLSGNVCVKQLYISNKADKIRRYSAPQEGSLIHSEAVCLDWGRILLDLTYQFIEHAKEGKEGDFPGTIPKLRFIEAAIAEVSEGSKFFLAEEWIDTSEDPFIKYINNNHAGTCISPEAPEETQNIANFLCFAQHVQYQVTSGTLITSDYQGMPQMV